MGENGVRRSYGAAGKPPAYSRDLIADQAVGFVDLAVADGRPFFLIVSPKSPHSPWDPAPRHAGAFSSAAPFRPTSYYEPDVSDKPSWVRAFAPLNFLSDLGSQGRRMSQLEMQLSIDELVAALLAKLEEHGIQDETAILYTSDNGQAWGEHRWTRKGCPWEECLRVPLIVRYPGLAPIARVEESLAVSIDIAPTIAALAGVEPPSGRDGRSLLRALDATEQEPLQEFLIESYAGPDRTFVGIHTGGWKLVLYASSERELYGLATDLSELENRAGQPEYAEIEAALEERIFALWPEPEGTPF